MEKFWDKIKLSLVKVFEEDPKEVDLVLEEAKENKNNWKSLHHYTSYINNITHIIYFLL